MCDKFSLHHRLIGKKKIIELNSYKLRTPFPTVLDLSRIGSRVAAQCLGIHDGLLWNAVVTSGLSVLCLLCFPPLEKYLPHEFDPGGHHSQSTS